MPDRMIQAPVSLIERARDALIEVPPSSRNADIYGELSALLSQPTPSAEPTCTCGHIMDDHDLSETGECQVAIPWCPCTSATNAAAPVDIASMAPGTTLTASMLPGQRGDYRPDGWQRERRWFVFGAGKGVRVVSDSGWPYQPDDIDPSTIREVTPPAAPEVD